jgi:hypothetical protein
MATTIQIVKRRQLKRSLHAPNASGLFPDNVVKFLMRSCCFVMFGAIFFKPLTNKHLAPKAEVTGSNPVGCANFFNGLWPFLQRQTGVCPENVRKICSRAVAGKIRNRSAYYRPLSPGDAPVTIQGECK